MARRERERVPQFVYRGGSDIVRRECVVSKVEGRSWNLLQDAITTVVHCTKYPVPTGLNAMPSTRSRQHMTWLLRTKQRRQSILQYD